jgi:hypothetical protein
LADALERETGRLTPNVLYWRQEIIDVAEKLAENGFRDEPRSRGGAEVWWSAEEAFAEDGPLARSTR